MGATPSRGNMAEGYTPPDLFVGATQLFAVVLPGAIFTFLCVPFRDERLPAILGRIPEGAERWIAFGVTSYVVGHFLFAIGSLILDPIYDRFYAKTKRVNPGLLPTSQPTEKFHSKRGIS